MKKVKIVEFTGVWDFVEKNYPNYTSCPKITLNEDLHKINDGELTGNAEKMYNEEIAKKTKELYRTHSIEQIKSIVENEFYIKALKSNKGILRNAISHYIAPDKENENLQMTVSKILKKLVTTEEAILFAVKEFETLADYLRNSKK